MYVVRCSACGFELYRDAMPVTIYKVAAMWGGRCPRCMSPIVTLERVVLRHGREETTIEFKAGIPEVK